MNDLKLTGYTVESFSTNLTPDIANMVDNPISTMHFQCNTGLIPNTHSGALRIEMHIEAKNRPGESAFAFVDGRFVFVFDAPDLARASDFEDALRTSGLQSAIPVIRGLVVGVAKMLNLPDVFSFPLVDPSEIKWSPAQE